MKGLGERIKSYRQKKGLSQQQIAHSLLVSPQAVSNWEREQSSPDISLLQPLSQLLDISLDQLLSPEQSKGLLQCIIFYSSIRGFAEKALSLNPKDYADLLNEIHEKLTLILVQEQGVPVKYLGDGFLAYFSGFNAESRALKTAQKCIEKLNNYPFLISLHNGEVFFSKIGHHEYSSLDIVGQDVNETILMNHWANSHTTDSLLISESLKTTIPEITVKNTYSFQIGTTDKKIYSIQ